jgi:SMC interacting uncharacterized protein involved in chromosome segregation
MKEKSVDTQNHQDVLEQYPFSQKTLLRLEEINAEIYLHEENITYLQAIADDRIPLRKKGATAEIRGYQRTHDDEARLPRTLDNLQKQIDLLQFEREVLKKYGR